jgi:hypothetical protein
MTDSPGTIAPANPASRVNRISEKARPNTSVRSSLPDALRDALADAAFVADLTANGARVSFVADAYCTVDGLHALRHREFPTSSPSRGVTMAGETLTTVVTLGQGGDWPGAARCFIEAFRAASGSDLDVVRIFTLRFIVS